MTLILILASLSQQQEAQRAAERILQVQQRAVIEQRDHEAYWTQEDAWAKQQRGRKATQAELDRLVVKP